MVSARSLSAGRGEGPVLELTEPISLWGGVDMATGEIVEASHPQAGMTISGKVLLLDHGRGSSSASSVLAEMVRTGRAPSAIVLGHPDPVIVLGAVVAAEMYGESVPVVLVDPAGWAAVAASAEASVDEDGTIQTGVTSIP